MLAARLADFFFRSDARNGPPEWIFYFADLAQKNMNIAALLKLAVSPSSGMKVDDHACDWVARHLQFALLACHLRFSLLQSSVVSSTCLRFEDKFEEELCPDRPQALSARGISWLASLLQALPVQPLPHLAGASILALRFPFHSVFHNSTTVLSTTANSNSESFVVTFCETSDYLSSDYFDRRRTRFCVDSHRT
jgi:hypothetical protein